MSGLRTGPPLPSGTWMMNKAFLQTGNRNLWGQKMLPWSVPEGSPLSLTPSCCGSGGADPPPRLPRQTRDPAWPRNLFYSLAAGI